MADSRSYHNRNSVLLEGVFNLCGWSALLSFRLGITKNQHVEAVEAYRGAGKTR